MTTFYRRNLPHMEKPGATYFVNFSTRKEFFLVEDARTLIFDHCLFENGRKVHMHAFVIMPDHVHMCIAIPPKHPVASVIGFLKGKSAIAIARLCGKERNFAGEHFWARGYAVSTVGFELEQVRQYIREQQHADGTSGQF